MSLGLGLGGRSVNLLGRTTKCRAVVLGAHKGGMLGGVVREEFFVILELLWLVHANGACDGEVEGSVGTHS